MMVDLLNLPFCGPHLLFPLEQFGDAGIVILRGDGVPPKPPTG